MTNTTIALVTGANRGIGYEIARQLGKSVGTVLVGARDDSRGETAARTLRDEGIDVHHVRLDVTDAESVAAAAKRVEAEYGRLDILVNNAGIFIEDMETPPSGASMEQLRETYETNVFGVVAVTNAFVPLLRQSAAGRIVNMSSELGSLASLSDPENEFYGVNALAYNSSKTALNALTLAYAKELGAAGIKVNSADPGYVATDMNGYSGAKPVEEGAAEAVRLATLGEGGITAGFSNDQGHLGW